MFKCHKQLWCRFAGKGNQTEGEEIESHKPRMHHRAQQLYSHAAGWICGAAQHMLIFNNRADKVPLLSGAELAGGGEQIGQAGEYALCEHVFKPALVLYAEFEAQLLHLTVDFQADLGFLVVKAAYETFARRSSFISVSATARWRAWISSG